MDNNNSKWQFNNLHFLKTDYFDIKSDISSIICNQFVHFLGGNQRDLARAKNLKKNQDQQKRNDDGMTPGQRKERWVEGAKYLESKITNQRFFEF